MALPVVGAIARKVFRDKAGRFISKAKHELLARQSLVTGRFITTKAAGTERILNRALENILGRPPGGMEWLQIATKYSDRFGDVLAEAQSQL